MKYNNHLNYKKRRRFIWKVKVFLVLVFIFLLASAAFFYLKYFSTDTSTGDTATSQQSSSYVSPSRNVFRSVFFQFQANSNWLEAPTESTQNKFVYRSLRFGLIEHELTIYVNQIPTDFQSTRVLPVNFTDSQQSRFQPGEISQHCSENINQDRSVDDVQQISLSGVQMTCYGGLNQYNVVVGLVDGSQNITMIRSDGTTAVYTIHYRDLRAINDASEITQIVSSFQAR